jgi:hypothetical protein
MLIRIKKVSMIACTKLQEQIHFVDCTIKDTKLRKEEGESLMGGGPIIYTSCLSAPSVALNNYSY